MVTELGVTELETAIQNHFGVTGATESIAAAWQVVEHMGDGIVLTKWYRKPGDNLTYTARFGAWSADAETVPLAICRAALKAIRA